MGLVLPGAPFSISPDAALWVVAQLRAVDARPETAGLVPALCHVFNSTVGDGKGTVLEHIPYPHYDIGWYEPEEAGAGDGISIEIFGRTVFLHNPTLKELRGKHLTLHRVESTLASRLPPGETRYVLREGAEEKGIFKFLGQ
jgi:hypothetical protein